MNKIAIKWWCDDCAMFTIDSVDEHEARKEQYEYNRARQIRDETEHAAGDFSGASYDVDGGR